MSLSSSENGHLNARSWIVEIKSHITAVFLSRGLRLLGLLCFMLDDTQRLFKVGSKTGLVGTTYDYDRQRSLSPESAVLISMFVIKS